MKITWYSKCFNTEYLYSKFAWKYLILYLYLKKSTWSELCPLHRWHQAMSNNTSPVHSWSIFFVYNAYNIKMLINNFSSQWMLIKFVTPKLCGRSANIEDWKSDVDRRTMIVRQDLERVMGKRFELNCLLVLAWYVAFVQLLAYFYFQFVIYESLCW